MAMKQYVLALAALIALSAGGITAAKAVEFDVDPGDVYVGQHWYHNYDRDRFYGSYNRYGGDSCGMWLYECRALTVREPVNTKSARKGAQRS